MASDRQIAANRLNARSSTGPRTIAGRMRSRRNAIKHGLTARTVVDVFEDADAFSAFTKEVMAAYKIDTAVQRELVHRLAGLLWRLRRANAFETGLFTIQAEQQRHLKLSPDADDPARRKLLTTFGLYDAQTGDLSQGEREERTRTRAKANAFLKVSNIAGDALERLNRYEVSLWRQAAQTIVILEGLRHRGTRLPGPANDGNK